VGLQFYKNSQEMNRTSVWIILITALLLSSVIFIWARENKKLEKEKEELILRNDSLHIIQLKMKNELNVRQNRLDSLFEKK
jgi:hypothetical protein